MIHDVANPLNYTIDTKYRVGIDLPKSVYLCKECSKEYEPWYKMVARMHFICVCSDCRKEDSSRS